MKNVQRLLDLINSAETVAVISHINPDGDTLGSGGAITLALTKLGKSVGYFCDDKCPDKLDFLYPHQRIKTVADRMRYDLAIAIDVSDKDRMGAMECVFDAARHTACIDHHRTNPGFAEVTMVKPDLSSCSEYMFDIIMAMGEDLMDSEIAALLYAGILTDSGGFYYPATTADTHLTVSKLMRYGFDANYIYFKTFREVTRAKSALHNRVLAATKYYDDGRIALIHFRREDFEETGTDLSHTEGAVSVIMDTEGVIAGIAITDVTDTSFKISLRSKGDVDVSRAASVYGGGGHKNAAGLRLNGYYYDVVDKVLKIVRDEI